MRQRTLATLAATLLAVSASLAQQPPAPKPLQFEAAAIRPADPKLDAGAYSSKGPPGGHLRIVNTPLRQWVETALSIQDYALKAPPWLETTRFDLDALLPSRPADQSATAAMMKALLVERFGLKWHEEPQAVPGYDLVVDKKLLVEPSDLIARLQGHGSSSGPTLVQATNIPLSELAEMLSATLRRPVVDRTQAPGVYTFKLMWSPSDPTARANQQRFGVDVDNLPGSLGAALHEKLGLRLQNAKLPSKLIVIDAINRQPTAN